MNGHLSFAGSAVGVLLMHLHDLSYLGHPLHTHESDNRGACVVGALLGAGGHGVGGGGGIVALRGVVPADGPALPEEPLDGPDPGGP